VVVEVKTRTDDAFGTPAEAVGPRKRRALMAAAAEYRAVVKLSWYKANGDVLGTATERVDNYDTHEGIYSNPVVAGCSDYFA